MAAQVPSQKERPRDRDAGNKSSVSKTEAWKNRAERAESVQEGPERADSTRNKMGPARRESFLIIIHISQQQTKQQQEAQV